VTDAQFLSASDLIAHDLIEWQEAVAIVQAVCDRLSAEGGGVPELEQIGLLSTGDVLVRPVAASPEPAARLLGHRLVALLERSNPPAPLRLFASQVTASSPLYTSLDDFSRGLAYFGRPDRARILQDLYQRAIPALAARPAAAAVQPAGRRETAPAPPPRRRGLATAQRRFIVAATVVAMAGAASVVGWRRFDVGTTGPKFLSRTTASTATFFHAGVSSGTDLLRKAGLVSPLPVVPPPEPATEARRARRVPESAPIETDAAPTSSGTLPSSDASPPGPSDLSINGPVTAPPDLAPTVADQPAVDSRIYTADDAGVSLPILSSHQLPTPPENSKAPSVVVDLLINERGTVESVKLVTPPTDMRQRMLISALKAWQYQPALKDGRPVRFLHRVKVTP
jgi:hypothetical protein